MTEFPGKNNTTNDYIFQTVLDFFRKNKRPVSLFLVLTILFAICVLVLWNANWVFEMFWADEYQFVSTTAIGKPSHAWTGAGRFWPLGLCDYCLLLIIPYGSTVTAHLLYNCTTMIASCLLLFAFLKKLIGDNSYIPAFCMLILFSLSSFVLIHMSCIYPERAMFLMFSAFLFFYWKAVNEENNLRNYGTAFLVAVYATYLKEPVFFLWFVFALSNFIFGKLSAKERKFNYALLMNSAIWLAIFVYRSIFRDRTLIDSKPAYASFNFDFSLLFTNCVNFVNEEPFLFILFLIGFIRFFSLLSKKSAYNKISDASLFSAIAYAFVYIVLNYQKNHYSFPSIIFGIPAFALFLATTGRFSKIVLVSISIVSSMYSINGSVWWINNILKHRHDDPLIFSELIEKHKMGKRILWITEKGKEKLPSTLCEVDSMKFRRYQIFLDYYSGGNFPFIKESDYSKIDKNTVVICANETLNSEYGEEIITQIKKEKLTLSHENNDLGTKIFTAAP